MDQTRLDWREIRLSEDAYVDRLFQAAPAFGAPLLCANVPRAFIDLNRAPSELDPDVIAGLPRTARTSRTRAGLGVIPRIVTIEKAIYSRKLSRKEAERRISGVYHPYHDALRRALNESVEAYGFVVLFDCHSMPRKAMQQESLAGKARPDIVLGDRHGRSAADDIVDRTEAAFAEAGFRVARNVQFAGAYTLQRHGRPDLHRHAVQIEIDRSLYLDEATIRPSADFDIIRRMLDGVVAQLAEIGRNRLPLAAE